MHRKTLVVLAMAYLVLLAMASGPMAQPASQPPTQKQTGTVPSRTNKAVVLELFDDVIGKGNIDALNRLLSEDYIQHDPLLETGRAPLIKFLQESGAFSQPTQGGVRRIIEDGDFVAVHSDYPMGDTKLAWFDLFRLEQGVIVEHWDVMQEQPEKTASGRTMVDGPTAITDREKTQANKQLVKTFFDTVLIGGQVDKAAQFFDKDTYLQHNPNFPDGLASFLETLHKLKAQGTPLTIKTLHRVVGEGNFVLTQSEGEFAGKPSAIYDLFRVEHGKIVEHWDVIQEIPAESKNTNGMF